MQDCIFCRIAAGEIPAQVVYQDEEILAFRDINSQAPVHILLIPRLHICDLKALTPSEDALVGKLQRLAGQLAVAEGLGESGFRVLSNTGPDAGQAVFHLHYHLLGGKELPALG